jgi:ribosomal protein L39E
MAAEQQQSVPQWKEFRIVGTIEHGMLLLHWRVAQLNQTHVRVWMAAFVVRGV